MDEAAVILIRIHGAEVICDTVDEAAAFLSQMAPIEQKPVKRQAAESAPPAAPVKPRIRRGELNHDRVIAALRANTIVEDAIKSLGVSSAGFYCACKRHSIKPMEHLGKKASAVISGSDILPRENGLLSSLIACLVEADRACGAEELIVWLREGEEANDYSDEQIRVGFANLAHDHPETFVRRGGKVLLSEKARREATA